MESYTGHHPFANVAKRGCTLEEGTITEPGARERSERGPGDEASASRRTRRPVDAGWIGWNELFPRSPVEIIFDVHVQVMPFDELLQFLPVREPLVIRPLAIDVLDHLLLF